MPQIDAPKYVESTSIGVILMGLQTPQIGSIWYFNPFLGFATNIEASTIMHVEYPLHQIWHIPGREMHPNQCLGPLDLRWRAPPACR